MSILIWLAFWLWHHDPQIKGWWLITLVCSAVMSFGAGGGGRTS